MFIIKVFSKLKSTFLLFLIGHTAYARKLGVKIGNNGRVYTAFWGSEPFLISIGDRVTVTSGVKILTHDGSTWLVRDNGVRYQKYSPVKIGSDVFIGVNTIIMPGVTIGSHVVIGAGSVVTKDIPDRSVAVGNPARVISNYHDFEEKIRNSCVIDSDLSGISNYKERVFYAIKIMDHKK